MKRLFFLICGLMLTASMTFAQGNYFVQPGDTLRIEVLEDSNLNRTVLVTPDGRFAFPFAGTLRASGRTVEQIRRSVIASIKGSFASEPTVFVSVAALRLREEPEEEEPATIDVYFLGEVNTPGLVLVEPGTTFLQGLSQAGGFTNFAATKRVQLRRTDSRTGQQTVTTINYRALSEGAALSRSIRLYDGDVILIPERRLFE